ncbi:MAG TPA: hypothetical protein EYM38_04890 [Dehalococcoidia bacterium]|nr:hypothetical protein [Dehalococcoidia bacterium]
MEFHLIGLPPWWQVDVTFLEPDGKQADWISKRDSFLLKPVGGRLTTRSHYADTDGRASWVRYGTQDLEGSWTIKLDFAHLGRDRNEAVHYQLQDLTLTDVESFHLGPHMSGLHGPEAGVFFSDDVNAAIAADMQTRLALASAQMEEAVGEPLGPVPDVYMVGSRVNLDILSQATLVDLGWEAGYYRNRGFKPGVYMMADELRTGLESVLVHEYLHHVSAGIVGLAREAYLPAWLNEGLAKYYEHELGLEQPRPDPFRYRMFRDADHAKSAALSGTLFPLESLESGSKWRNRSDPDEVALQYDQVYMVIRFMIETFGASSPFDALREIAAGEDIPEALEAATGLGYEDFESEFLDWISSWEDPERSEAIEYFQDLDLLLAQLDEILDRRNKLIQRSLLALGSVSNSQFVDAYTEMVGDAQGIVGGLALVTPPVSQEGPHTEAALFLDLHARWLSLEGEYQRTRLWIYQQTANDLLPEVNARRNLLSRDLADAKWVLNLP